MVDLRTPSVLTHLRDESDLRDAITDVKTPEEIDVLLQSKFMTPELRILTKKLRTVRNVERWAKRLCLYSLGAALGIALVMLIRGEFS